MSDVRQRGPARFASRVVRFAPILTALAFGWWMLARRQYLLIDDAYISFRYATNFAHGDGLVWNVGVPVEGYTCLLWVLLLSAIARTGVDLMLPATLLSTLFGLGCLELLRRIARARATPVPSAWEVAPGMLLASLPPFAHAMTSGMEETCFAFLSLLGIHLLILARARPELRRWVGFTFAAACLTRPEGALVAGVAIATEAVLIRSWRDALRTLFVPAASVAIVVLAHTAFRLAYYGYPFPNTFYAKVIFGPATLDRGVTHLAGFLSAGGWLLIFGIPTRKHDLGLRPWLIHGYALAVVYCAYLLVVGGDHPRWQRFYIPLLPIPLLGASERLRAWTQSWRLFARPARAWPALFAYACACGVVAWSALPFSEAHEPIVGVIDLRTKKLMDEVDRFFSEVPQDSFCAVAAIGYVGYRHLGLHILDTWGLTDTHIAHLKVAPTVKFGHDKQDTQYVAAMKPDYVYTFGPPRPMPGYDLCWPSENPPAVVYRRNVPLLAAETALGVPKQRTRRIEPPPPCRPPANIAPPAPAPAARVH